MPKKRQSRALLTKPASSAPSTLQLSQTAPVDDGGPFKRTVNDLLRASRRPHDGRNTVDIAATSSLHPALRAVLDMPVPSPPLVRTQLRGPARLRRIPGPPPPQSWLSDSQHAPESSRSSFHQLRWLKARIQQQSNTLPGGNMPKQDSLEHVVLKAIATNWTWHAEFDNTYLATLPVSIRITLLSYLAVYDEAHWPSPFPFLFPSECEQDELDAVARLDLANSIGGWANIRKIEKELVIEVAKKHTDVHQDGIPDSWDAEELVPSSSIPKLLISNRFSNLKHLSLAVNSTSAGAPPSWSALVGLSAHLSRLTSLSLAHWPTPTYTPNASNGRMKMSFGPAAPSLPGQIFGGTDMYSAFDNNWREAAGILKSLSRNLYCLTWLDLGGCGPWLNALTWEDEDGQMVGAEWNGAWRNLTTLILAVGWLPGRLPVLEDDLSASRSTSSIDSTRAIEQLYGSSQAIQASLAHLSELRLQVTPGALPIRETPSTDPPWNVEFEREKQYFRKDVERYTSQRNMAKQVASQIRAVRRDANGKYLQVELGEELGDEYSIV